MALTRITSTVIKDSTIEEGKFTKPYLDSESADTAKQAITFESSVNISNGTGVNPYFTATNEVVQIEGSNGNASVLNITKGGIALSDGDITISDDTATRRLKTPYLDVGNGRVDGQGDNFPGIYFDGAIKTGFYRTASPTESVSISIDGNQVLSVEPAEFKFGTNDLKILGSGGSYTSFAGYETSSDSLTFGKSNEKLELKVDNDIVVNVRSVDAGGNAYPDNENRVGINTTTPAATLDVNGTIRGINFQGPDGSFPVGDLPIIPIVKGGLNISTIGSPGQLLRVNEGATAYEFFDQSSGDPNNLKSFGVAGDGALYDVSNRDIGTASKVRLYLNSTLTFKVDHAVKVFGINTTDYLDYDWEGLAGSTYNGWASSIDGEQLNLIYQSGPSGGSVQYTYYACLMNTKTGVISTPKKLKHKGPQTSEYILNYPLGNFNESIYNTVPLQRPTIGAPHAILLYRRVDNTNVIVDDRNQNQIPGHNDKVNLIAIIGNREIGSSTQDNFNYNDYGPYNRTSWGDFNTDGTYNQQFQEVGNIPCSLPLSNITKRKARPGWAYRNVDEVNYANNTITISDAEASDNSDNTDTAILTLLDLNGFDANNKGFFNSVQVSHDDTVPLQTAIDEQVDKGLNSLYVIGGTYLVRRLVIPSSFSFVGSGKATKIKKQYFDTEYQKTTGALEYSRFYAALWMRDGTNAQGAASVSESKPIKDVTVRDMVIDGNYNSQARLGLSTTPQANALIYCEEIENANFSSLDIKNSVGDGIYAESSNRMSIQNCSVFDNSITYATFDSPLNATNSTVLKVSDSAFLATPGPVDITTSEVVAFNSCIIRNCGTGLRIYGAKSANTENNLVLGPDDEWIPTEDIYDSDYNSVNITCYKTVGTGTNGSIKFTFVEDNLAKDLTNTTVSATVYKILVDNLGNETIIGTLNYRQDGNPSNPEISVLAASVYDGDNGGVQIQIVSAIDANGNYEIFPQTATQAVHSIPYRTTLSGGAISNNYNYLAYSVVGQESLAIGAANEYIIDGVIDYDSTNERYQIKIDTDVTSDFETGDLVTLKEHATAYGLPQDMTVVGFGFAEQSFTLILSFTGGFNTYHDQNNTGNGWNPATNVLTIDAGARGYIEKKRSFTIAKGIIGVE